MKTARYNFDVLEQRLAEAFDALWDSFVDPREPFCDDGERWLPLAGYGNFGRTRILGSRERSSIGRHPPAVPLAGARQRVRHQRPRKPHQLHRRQRAHLPRHVAERKPVAPARAIAVGRRRAGGCSTSSSAPTTGTAGNRRSSAAAIATAKPSCGSFRRPTAARGCGSSSRPRLPRRQRYQADPAARLGIQTDRDDVETVLGYFDRRPADRRRRDSASQGQRRRQREARPAAVLSRAQKPPPRGEAAAQHERRGRNSIGHRPDPQAPPRHGQRRAAVRRRPGRPCRAPAASGPHESSSTLRTGHDPRRPRPASNTSFPPPASTPATTWPCCRPSCGRSPAGW